jgi:ADP-ribose pyrophosphatase
MTESELQPWEVLSRRELLDARPWLRVWADDIKLPDGRVVEGYYRLEMPDYVMIVATTDDGSVVMQRQYKHGAGSIGINLPAGYLDPGEDALQAAQRELQEETGYAAEGWRFLGSFVNDGNRGGGTAHIFLARGAHRVAEPNSGDLEEMQIGLMPLDDLAQAALSGNIPLLSTAAAIGLAIVGSDEGIG